MFKEKWSQNTHFFWCKTFKTHALIKRTISLFLLEKQIHSEKSLPAILASHMGTSPFPLSYFWPSILLMLGKSNVGWPQCLGFYCSNGKPGRWPYLLVSPWLSPGHCHHLGSDTADERSLCLPESGLSQINTYFKKIINN